MSPASPRRDAARVATVLALGTAALALTGCSDIADDFADLYSITYEVTADGRTDGAQSDAGIADVRYAEASHRGRPSIIKEAERASLALGDDAGTSIWSTESYVTAEDWAFVQATPTDGEALTCRILIDGVREIASSTAAPGQPVTCQVPTPAFS